MGRLFWKFFAAIFLALLSTVLTVGNIVQWEVHHNPQTGVYSFYMSPLSGAHDKPLANFQSNPQQSTPFPAVANELDYVHLLLSFPFYALVFCLVISALFSGILAWSIAHPVKLLLEHLKRIAEGDMNVRVTTKIGASHDEFSELGAAFDLMANQLSTMIKSQSNMLHHVSHELRSPLARIQMAVGLAIQNESKARASLQRVELEAVRMEKMIAELLEIFRLESGVQKLNKTKVDLKGLVNGIVADIQFEKQSFRLSLEMPDQPVIVSGQSELLQRAIENVIRNAVKYGPLKGLVLIELQVSQRTGEVIVEVQDQGQGVAQTDLEQIFKPFVRGRDTTQIEGHGIGLAITKHIVEAHGGFVKATNLSPSGFMVRIHLPHVAQP